jgi:hypothetical protein
MGVPTCCARSARGALPTSASALITVKDILTELEKPGRDPRPDFKVARFNEGVEDLKDLQPGMVLEGTVSNVAQFGAFVDLGVHQDGLMHVSQLSRQIRRRRARGGEDRPDRQGARARGGPAAPAHLAEHEDGRRTPLGYLGAFLTNSVHRRSMGAWLERVVFSSPGAALPFLANDYRTRQVALSEANFNPALQASCSIPFVLKAVHNVPGAPPGAYWDGGITDYHLHLNYAAQPMSGLVLYPHFQKAVVPGWLDKSLRWRHGATHFLDNMVVLAPDPDWVRTLPNSKLPDRTDFTRYGRDLAARINAWTEATAASALLAEEFARWLKHPDPKDLELI